MNDNDDTCRTDNTTDDARSGALLGRNDAQVLIPAEPGPARWQALLEAALSYLEPLKEELFDMVWDTNNRSWRHDHNYFMTSISVLQMGKCWEPPERKGNAANSPKREKTVGS